MADGAVTGGMMTGKRYSEMFVYTALIATGTAFARWLFGHADWWNINVFLVIFNAATSAVWCWVSDYLFEKAMKKWTKS